MIVGVNEHFPSDGNDFHIQIEDLDGSWELEVRVYLGGSIVFHKRQSYLQQVQGCAEAGQPEKVVAEEMHKLLALVKAAIQKGRIGAGGA